MKDTDAYYKRELTLTLTKGDEKVVYLQGEKWLEPCLFYGDGSSTTVVTHAEIHLRLLSKESTGQKG